MMRVRIHNLEKAMGNTTDGGCSDLELNVDISEKEKTALIRNWLESRCDKCSMQMFDRADTFADAVMDTIWNQIVIDAITLSINETT